MYYYAEKKLAFAMPPRTGSTMFNRLLLEWGAKALNPDRHAKPSEVIISEPHTIYGFFRDPLDRYLSMVRYFRAIIDKWYILVTNPNYFNSVGMTAEEIQQITYDQFIDFPVEGAVVKYYKDPQIDWLANAELLNFNNYRPEVLRVARMFDVKEVTISLLNDSEKTNEQPSQRVIDYVRSFYAEDYRLGRERGLLI